MAERAVTTADSGPSLWVHSPAAVSADSWHQATDQQEKDSVRSDFLNSCEGGEAGNPRERHMPGSCWVDIYGKTQLESVQEHLVGGGRKPMMLYGQVWEY